MAVDIKKHKVKKLRIFATEKKELELLYYDKNAMCKITKQSE